MYYINADNMMKAMSKAELVQLTNDEPRATEPDMAVVDESIRRVELQYIDRPI